MLRDRINTGHREFRGHPNCQAIHDDIVAWLNSIGTTSWLSGPLDTRTQGNLGETIGFRVGHRFGMGTLQCFAANAFQPLQGISKPEIDLVWMHFGKRTKDDFIILQEIKTTIRNSVSYANALKIDYDKLFGKDPRFTLNARLGAAAARLKYEQQRPDLCRRILALMAKRPSDASGVKLFPTLVHDLSSISPNGTLAGIRTHLAGKGWRNVEAWSIGLCNLAARLTRISKGQR